MESQWTWMGFPNLQSDQSKATSLEDEVRYLLRMVKETLTSCGRMVSEASSGLADCVNLCR
jgi:hypothetical protein